MGPFRLKIVTQDKIGMTLEILKEIYKINISMNSMDVFPKEVYLKILDISEKEKTILKENILNLDGVIEVEQVNLIPMEKNERKLLAIIDSVDEGIMAINKKREIEIFNSSCEDIFNYKKEELIGKSVETLLPKDAPIIKLLYGGDNYDNLEFKLKNKRAQSHYLSTGRAIKDDEGDTIGGVVSIRDYDKVKELAEMVSSYENKAFEAIVGKSKVIEDIKKLISSISNSSSTVLLRGESGTGKELFARAIHDIGNKSEKPFIAINCAAIPMSLMESELFGYESGSFTGALNQGKDGLFKMADGGILFLDEIGELDINTQAKLLRVLQEGKYRKIGGKSEIKIDVRIICATNRNLEEMITKKEFREDLYYRLNVIPIYIPPLRERKDDIVFLLRYFIDKINKKLSKDIKGFTVEYLKGLMDYSWPGNIRELENIIERSMNLVVNQTLDIEDLMIKTENLNFTNKQKDRFNFKIHDLKTSVEEYEKVLIKKALEENKNIRKTARVLGVSHATIINKIKKYSIKR